MKVSMKFEGGAELAAHLRSLSTRVSKRIAREALDYAAEPIRRRASQIAPRAPGAPDIANNIVISRARSQDGAPTVAIGPAREFRYGFFLEFGTSRMGAQPFMRPAFDGEAANSLQRLRQELWRALAERGISRTLAAPSTPSGPGALV